MPRPPDPHYRIRWPSSNGRHVAHFPGIRSLHVDCSQPGDYVMMAVSDMGSGIDRGPIQRIFVPLFAPPRTWARPPSMASSSKTAGSLTCTANQSATPSSRFICPAIGETKSRRKQPRQTSRKPVLEISCWWRMMNWCAVWPLLC
ncbi:hypothetical protein DFAR_3820003 [Desulfarculales bacterium]